MKADVSKITETILGIERSINGHAAVSSLPTQSRLLCELVSADM